MYAILARKSPWAVIFRRGPSRQVLLIRWNTQTDVFQIGQWFKGRIYERRCDLSPQGDKLIYFAASFRKPYYSWTAVSTPPYLTALIMWPKGDTWGGGGLFETDKRISLNHRTYEMELKEKFTKPKQIKVAPFEQWSGEGEDGPILVARLRRDGWRLIEEPTGLKNPPSPEICWYYDRPYVWAKSNPRSKNFRLEMEIEGIHKKDGPWYLTSHAVWEGETPRIEIPQSDWADWSPSGDLLYSIQGKLYRVRFDHEHLTLDTVPKLIADFSSLKFENLAAPHEALVWNP
jgi:hypothetical protein